MNPKIDLLTYKLALWFADLRELEDELSIDNPDIIPRRQVKDIKDEIVILNKKIVMQTELLLHELIKD